MGWYAPIDPNCPKVTEFMNSLFDDPMTAASGAPVDEIVKDFEKKHLAECEHCQEFGCENIEVR